MDNYTIPRGILILLTLLWLAIMAFLLAHLTSLFVAEAIGAKVGPMRRVISVPSIPALPSPQELGHLILQSSVFPGDRHVPVFSDAIDAQSQLSSIPPNVELVGTVVGSRAVSYAILQTPQSASQTLYRLGDLVPYVGTLVRINRHRVLIELQDGRQAILEAEWLKNRTTSSPPPKVTQRRFSDEKREVRTVMQRREIVEAFSNLPHLLQQAKATPVISGAGMDGVSFEVIQSASIFDRLGFRVGDELKAINGVPLRDPGTLLTALRQIEHESAVALDVVRNNQNIIMRYDIR